MTSSACVYASSARNWPSRCSARLQKLPVYVPEIACSDSLARVRQWSTARGNSRSSTRNFTTFTGGIRPCRWRYISSALAERSRASHWMSSNGVPTSASLGSRMKYFTSRIREVLSARSSIRPSWQKCQASPCVIVASVTPRNCWPETLTLLEEVVRIVEHVFERAAVADHQVELVDVLPHLGRDDLADAAGVFAGRPQAGQDRIRVLGVEREKLDDAFLGGRADALLKLVVVAGDHHQRPPLLAGLARHVEAEVQIHRDEAGNVLGPLDVAAHPVDRIGDAAQHSSDARSTEQGAKSTRF